jgi:hypothetical protein
MMMFKFLKKKVAAACVAITAALAPVVAFAQAASTSVDVTGVRAAIDGALTPIATIGAGVLLVLVGIKVYKWVRRAM